MLNRQQRVLLPQLCRLIGSQFGGGLSDSELLDRFHRHRDGAAFAALVRRHGPAVLGVCRRVLRNAADAEDAFQATFLVLVRKAHSIARPGALGSWLYGVAYRVSLKARADAQRRRLREMQAASRTEAQAPPDETGDLRAVLDEEVNRLADKYRQPVLLCYFGGKTYQEAARLLGVPAGIVSVRLARARELLRSRLVRRGLSLSAVAVAAGLAEGPAPAAEVSLLAEATAAAALRFAAGPAAAGISRHVIALTEGVVKAMLLQKLHTLTGIILAVTLVCGGAGVLWHVAAQAPAAAADQPGEAEAPPASPPAADPFLQEPNRAIGAHREATVAPGGLATRPPQSKIGLLNMTRAIKSSKKFQTLERDLRDRMRLKEQKVADLQRTLQAHQAESQDPNAPADRREQAAWQVREVERQMKDEQDSARALMSRKTGAAAAALYREVREAARRVANVKGLELVMFYNDAVTDADLDSPTNLEAKLSQRGGLMPLVVAPGMDITDAVIDELNHAHATPTDSGR